MNYPPRVYRFAIPANFEVQPLRLASDKRYFGKNRSCFNPLSFSDPPDHIQAISAEIALTVLYDDQMLKPP